jgi:hypothetical protein
VHQHLQRALAVMEAAVNGATAEQLVAHAPGKWSIAENLEHLSITFTSTSAALRKCLDSGQTRARPATLRDRIAIFTVVSLGYLPRGRNAPAFTLPSGNLRDRALEVFRGSLGDMDSVLQQCEQRFGTRQKIATHPILGPLSVNQWRKFHYVHTRHHARTVTELRRKI